jgi:hypothetical protein
MHLTTLLLLMVSYAVAVSARALLTARAHDDRIARPFKKHVTILWCVESAQPSCFDLRQRAILQKWQRRFSSDTSATDGWKIAA